MATVRIAVSDLFAGDGIGNFILSMERFLASRGLACRLYATRCGQDLPDILPEARLQEDSGPEDIIFYNHSCGDPLLEKVATMPQRKIYYFHNITPGHWFAPYNPNLAALLDYGTTQLRLAARFQVVLANSWFSMESLLPHLPGSIPRLVCPPVVTPLPLQSSPTAPLDTLPEGEYLLCVGRIVPHKRALDMVDVFAALAGKRPALHCVIVGGNGCNDLYAELARRIESLPPAISSRVHRFCGLSNGQMRTVFERAKALVCLSRHEGFCLPLLEAMSCGLPVLARPQEAVRETLAGAGYYFREDKVEAIAAEIDGVLDDAALLHSLSRRGLDRAASLAAQADGSVLERALALCRTDEGVWR